MAIRKAKRPPQKAAATTAADLTGDCAQFSNASTLRRLAQMIDYTFQIFEASFDAVLWRDSRVAKFDVLLDD